MNSPQPYLRHITPLLLIVSLSPAGFSRGESPAPPPTQPVAPVRPVTETYYGQKVTDPYRWMEDLKSPELIAWMKAQNAYTRAYLEKLPDRDALLKRIKELDNAASTVGEVNQAGSHIFYTKTNPGDQTRKLYVRDAFNAPERLLVDPQIVGGKGKRYSLDYFSPSQDGSKVAFGISPGGSENSVLYAVDTAGGKVLGERIDRTEFGSVSWTADGKSFFYNRLQKLGPHDPPINKYLKNKIYLHPLGGNPDKDVPVLGVGLSQDVTISDVDEPAVVIPEDSPYALGIISHGVLNELTIYVASTDSVVAGKPAWTKVADVEDAVTGFAVHGNELYALTHKDAPRYRVARLDLAHPDIKTAETVVPAGDLVLQNIGAARDGIYIQALDGGIGRFLRLPYGEKAATSIKLPFDGSVLAFDTDVRKPGALARLSGWTRSPGWYAYDPATNQIADTGLEPKSPVDFSGIESEEVKARSADGTMVPLSIIHKKGLALDGNNPALLEGYGSYSISLDPFFDPKSLALMERGVVIAYAHVRGGGEYGEDWHKGGQKLTKQNTISDFIACAQYLVDNKYTSPGKLAGRGTSAGGITIGGALTQRPDLFTLAICNVGVMDAMRSETSPNGPPNIPEFGTVKDPDGFKGLYAMDAYQHVKDGAAYPTVLLITGANDPRVDSWELAKMTARLQAATSSRKPVLLRVDYDAGHGIGSSKDQRDLIYADQGALLLQCAK